MKDFNLRKYLAEGKLLKENISSPENKKEAKHFLEKFIDDNKDEFEFIPDLETGRIDAEDNSYNVDELASIFLDIGQDIPRGKYNQKYKGEGGTYVVVAENKLLKEEEFKLYTTNVKYDNGEDGYMYQLVDAKTGEENEIGFDQLYFIGKGDASDPQVFLDKDFKDFEQTSYQEEEVSAEEAMEIYNELK